MIFDQVVNCPYCGERVSVTPKHGWQVVWCSQIYQGSHEHHNKGCYKDFAVEFKLVLARIAKMEEVKL